MGRYEVAKSIAERIPGVHVAKDGTVPISKRAPRVVKAVAELLPGTYRRTDKGTMVTELRKMFAK